MTNDRPLSVPVILGTTRKGRMSAHAARFIVGQIEKRNRVTSELIDISKLPMPIDDAGEGIGGVRAIQDFLPVIRELGLVNIFWDVNFGNVSKVFDESGKLFDEAFVARADKFLNELVWMAKTLRYGRDNIALDS